MSSQPPQALPSSGDANNYPDILGYITGGKRANIGPIQIATALRPRVARAGRPFEMLMLIQNASDVAIEATVTLNLPQMDAKRQKGRFFSKADRLIIDLEAAAVGVAILPVSTMPDTAVGSDYKIGMEVKAAPAQSGEKPKRIRQPQGGGAFDLTLLSEDARKTIEDLKGLLWTANQGTLRSSILESSFAILSGTVGAIADLRPSWTSLWTLADYQDDSYLLHRYGGLLHRHVLAAMQRPKIYPVLQEYTAKRFARVGYILSELELDAITRLLTLVLEYANPQGKDMKFLLGAQYNVAKYFTEDGKLQRGVSVQLPRWAKAILRVFQKDERTALYPVKAIAHFVYDDLLYDAMEHAFDRVEAVLGMSIGTKEEHHQYIAHFFEMMAEGKLTFDLLYLPLIMGGMALNDGVLLKGEKAQDIIMNMRQMLQARFAEQNESTRPVYDMANRLLEQTASKYNFSEY
ncbi:MAG: hypothetical protein RML73_01345 [Anaerolineae bacterium]|nr:hypothetical protein [Anaerolineae bacterium]